MKYYFRLKEISFVILVAFVVSDINAQKDLLVLSKRQHAILYANFQDKETEEPMIIGNLLEGITESLYAPTDLIVDQNRKTLFVADPVKKQLENYNLDSKTLSNVDSTFATTPVDIHYLANSDEFMWLDSRTRSIYKGVLEGKQKGQMVIDSTSNMTGFAYAEERKQLFWNDHFTGRILFNSETDEEIKVLFEDTSARPIRLVLNKDQSVLYWSDDNHRIGKIDLESGENEYIYVGKEENRPISIIIDEIDKKLYWSDYGDMTVKISDLNGENIKILLEEIEEPVAIAFAPPIVELRTNQNVLAKGDEQFVLMPNPSQGKFTLRYVGTDLDQKTVIIYDSKGQMVHQVVDFRQSEILDLEHLNNGNYTAIIRTGKEAHIKKLVIVK